MKIPIILAFILLMGVCSATEHVTISASTYSLPKQGGDVTLYATFSGGTPPYSFTFYTATATGEKLSMVGSTAASNSMTGNLVTHFINGIYYLFAQGISNYTDAVNSTNLIEISTAPAFHTTVHVSGWKTDANRNLSFKVTASGGFPPYDFYYFLVPTPTNSTPLPANTIQKADIIDNSQADYSVNVIAGNNYYVVKVVDSTGNYTILPVYNFIGNQTPSLVLNPSYKIINPGTNITFTNHTVGGTPPFKNYTYDVSGGSYSIYKNIITFNSIALYNVTLHAFDKYGEEANGTAIVDVAYQPSIVKVHPPPSISQSSTCYLVANLSQTVPFTLNFSNSVKVNGIENFITPTYAGVTFNGNSVTLYPQNAVSIDGVIATLNAINWMPILVTINLTVCSGRLVTTSTTTTSTSTTSVRTTSTTSIRTTTIPPSNSIPSNSVKPESPSKAMETNILLVAIAVVLLLTIAAWLFNRHNKV